MGGGVKATFGARQRIMTTIERTGGVRVLLQLLLVEFQRILPPSGALIANPEVSYAVAAQGHPVARERESER